MIGNLYCSFLTAAFNGGIEGGVGKQIGADDGYPSYNGKNVGDAECPFDIQP